MSKINKPMSRFLPNPKWSITNMTSATLDVELAVDAVVDVVSVDEVDTTPRANEVIKPLDIPLAEFKYYTSINVYAPVVA
jgi:hypothetical protein